MAATRCGFHASLGWPCHWTVNVLALQHMQLNCVCCNPSGVLIDQCAGLLRDWKKQHAGFHSPMVYYFIVDTFEDPKDEVAKTSTIELLQWWNRGIFPATTNKRSVADSCHVMEMSEAPTVERFVRCSRDQQ